MSIPYTLLLQLGTGFDVEAVRPLVTARLMEFTKRRKEKLLRLTLHLVEAGGNCDVVAFGIEQHDVCFLLVGLTDELARWNDVVNHMAITKIIHYIKLFQSHVIYKAMAQASEQMFHVCPFHWTVDKMLLADVPIRKDIH